MHNWGVHHGNKNICVTPKKECSHEYFYNARDFMYVVIIFNKSTQKDWVVTLVTKWALMYLTPKFNVRLSKNSQGYF